MARARKIMPRIMPMVLRTFPVLPRAFLRCRFKDFLAQNFAPIAKATPTMHWGISPIMRNKDSIPKIKEHTPSITVGVLFAVLGAGGASLFIL